MRHRGGKKSWQRAQWYSRRDKDSLFTVRVERVLIGSHDCALFYARHVDWPAVIRKRQTTDSRNPTADIPTLRACRTQRFIDSWDDYGRRKVFICDRVGLVISPRKTCLLHSWTSCLILVRFLRKRINDKASAPRRLFPHTTRVEASNNTWTLF